MSTGWAPGKVILLGEHGVVYGHRAVAAAVSLGTTVQLTKRPGPTGMDAPWADDTRLKDALLCVLPPTGIGVSIQSDLPIGRGMGSSAALAVALGRARAALAGEPADDDRLNQDAWAVERVFHGNPSGIDHTVSMAGGAVAYRKTVDGPEITPLALSALPLVVIDSGSSGNTAEMVEGVRARRPQVDATLAEIGALVEAAIPLLAQPPGPALGDALNSNHRLLQQIGVSTPTLDALVTMALSCGAYGAKLAGAGGGGVVIALTEDRDHLVQRARAEGYDAMKISLGAAQRQ